MNETLIPYVPIFLFLLFAIGVAVTMVALSTWCGRPPRRAPRTDLEPYECGVPVQEAGGKRFTIRFYLVAMLFILFDLETAFLYPWAVVYRGLGWAGFWEMVVFIAVLAVGFVYIWRQGALDWKAEAPVRRRSAGA